MKNGMRALEKELAKRESALENKNELILDESRKERMEMKIEMRALEKELAKRESGLENKLETLITQGNYNDRHPDDYKWMFICSCVFVAFSAVLSIAAFMELKRQS
eukprot:456519_1